jgi:actin-related protein
MIDIKSKIRTVRHNANFKFDLKHFNIETREKEFTSLPFGIVAETAKYLSMETSRNLKEQIIKFYSLPRESEVDGFLCELPDGEKLAFNEKFNFSKYFFDFKNENSQSIEIQSLIIKSFQKCDIDARRYVTSSLVVTGGNSLIPNFIESLEETVNSISSNAFKVKVFASSKSNERKMAPWIGSSITSSTGAFQNMWMSKHEFAEFGESIILRKCVN